MSKLKSFLCKKCGETKPSKFHINNKSLCKVHYTKKYQRASADIPPPTMSPEEHKAYCDNATEVMKANLKMKRQELYG